MRHVKTLGSSKNPKSSSENMCDSESSDNKDENSKQSIQSRITMGKPKPSWASNYMMSIGDTCKLNLSCSRKKNENLKENSPKKETTQLTSFPDIIKKRMPIKETKSQQQVKSVNNIDLNKGTGSDKQLNIKMIKPHSCNVINTSNKNHFLNNHNQDTHNTVSDKKYGVEIIAPNISNYVSTPNKYKYIKNTGKNHIETGSDNQHSHKTAAPSISKYILTPDKNKYIKSNTKSKEAGSDKHYINKIVAPSTSKFIPTPNKYKLIKHDQNTNKYKTSKKEIPKRTSDQCNSLCSTTKTSIDTIKSRQPFQNSNNKIVKTSQQTVKEILQWKNTTDVRIKSMIIEKLSPIRKKDTTSSFYDKETIKCKEFYTNYKIPKISEKNNSHVEKKKANIIKNNTNMSRLSAKDIFAKELGEANCSTTDKSVVDVVDDSEKKLDTTFDLRSKLSRRSLNHYFTKLRNLSESTDSAPREQRDSLLISVPNDKDYNLKATGKRKLEDIKITKNKEIESIPPKLKKIKLVINVLYEKSSTSSSDTDDDVSIGTSNKEEKNVIANLDLSFLDDLNIDEIVQSLSSNKECRLPSVKFKGNAANDLSLTNKTDEINNNKDNNAKDMLPVLLFGTENERSRFMDNDIKTGSSNSYSGVISVKEHTSNNLIAKPEQETFESLKIVSNSLDILNTKKEDSICTDIKHLGKSNEKPIHKQDIQENLEKTHADNVEYNIDKVFVINEMSHKNNVEGKQDTRVFTQSNTTKNKLLALETTEINKTEDTKIKETNGTPEITINTVGIECVLKKYIFETYEMSQQKRVEDKIDVQEKHKRQGLETNNKLETISTNIIDFSEFPAELTKEVIKEDDNLERFAVKKDNTEIKFDAATQISNQQIRPVIELNMCNKNKQQHDLSMISKDITGIIDLTNESDEDSEALDVEIVDDANDSKENKKQSGTENTRQTGADESDVKTTEYKSQSKTQKGIQRHDANYTETTDQKQEPKTETCSKANNDESVAKISNTYQAATTNKRKSASVYESKTFTDIHVDLQDTEVYLAKRLEGRMKQYFKRKYILTSLLHYGEFSKIYECVNESGDKYALKVIKNSTMDYLIIKELQRDVPRENYHCVYILNGFGFIKHWCLLMELYPKNLKQALQENKRSFHINVIKNLSRQLVSAVTLLRHSNIVHTNIKPTHILVNSTNDQLKLCGFDEAQYKNDIQFSRNIGPMNYRAPEVILGHSAGFNMDVWSTALVMYEMATNIQLFPGVVHNDILYKQMFVCGPVPYEMIQQSIYKSEHFRGLKFMRQLKGGKCIPIPYHTIRKHDLVKKYVLLTYKNDWCSVMSYKQKQLDYAKLHNFCQLLHKMLVMDPQQRLPIEFVYADPFLFGVTS